MKLYRNVWNMLGLRTCGGFDFDKVECSVAIPRKDICPYPDLLESESTLKYSLYCNVS